MLVVSLQYLQYPRRSVNGLNRIHKQSRRHSVPEGIKILPSPKDSRSAFAQAGHPTRRGCGVANHIHKSLIYDPTTILVKEDLGRPIEDSSSASFARGDWYSTRGVSVAGGDPNHVAPQRINLPCPSQVVSNTSTASSSRETKKKRKKKNKGEAKQRLEATRFRIRSWTTERLSTIIKPQ